MQTLALISKSTKQGVSIWRFVSTPDGCFYAFGGCTPTCKQFDSLAELRVCYKNFVTRYGYKPGLVPATSVQPVVQHRVTYKPVKKQMFLSDPWASELPATEQMALEQLTAWSLTANLPG